MPKTTKSYVSDLGEVKVTISAGNATASAIFTTAETITLDGVVRSFRRTNDPQRSVESTRITGDTSPIVTAGKQVEHETWELSMVDDYSEGGAGEWGTDLLSGVQIFREFFALRGTTEIGGLAASPAGGATGDIEYTLVSPRVVSNPTPGINADDTGPNVVSVMIAAEKHTTAAHA